MESLILTKHALRLNGDLPSNSWLNDRRKYLVTTTAASLLQQTNSDFTWCILVDSEIFDDEVALLKEVVPARLSVLYLQINGELNPSSLKKAISDTLLLKPGEVVTSTILDNDDALSPEFVHDMRCSITSAIKMPVILDFTFGAVFDVESRVVMTRHYYRSCFQTLVEAVDDSCSIDTVFAFGHHLLADHFRYIEFPEKKIKWIMFVHGNNLGNQAWGFPANDSNLDPLTRNLLPPSLANGPERTVYFFKMITRYLFFVFREGMFRSRLKSLARNLRIKS